MLDNKCLDRVAKLVEPLDYIIKARFRVSVASIFYDECVHKKRLKKWSQIKNIHFNMNLNCK